MDEKRLKQTLEDIAREDIPETMDLWPSIQNRTQRLSHLQTSQKSRLTWVAAVILTLLMVAAGALALEIITTDDPGLQEAQGANLIENLNLSQTIGDYTLSLEWVYADANRVSMRYTLEGISPATELYYPVVINSALRDDQGRVFQEIPVGGGGGGGGGGSDASTATFTSYAETSYDASVIEGAPGQLNLRYEAFVGRAPWLDNNAAGDGGSDGSGSEMQPSPAPAMQPVGPFVFEFAVPFNPGRKLPAPVTASASGIDITLENFVVTPSMIRAVLCFDQPAYDANKPWSPFASLAADGQPIIENANLIWDYGTQSPDQMPSSRCNPYVVSQGSLALDQQQEEWTFTINELRVVGSRAEDIARLNETLAQYGVVITPIPGGGYSFDTPHNPDGSFLSDEEYMALMSQIDVAGAALDATITGPWTFTFNLP